MPSVMKTQFGLKQFKSLDAPMSAVAVAGKTFYIAYTSGEVVRIFPTNESEKLKFAATAVSSFMAPAFIKVEVARIYACSFHAIFTTTGMDTFFVSIDSTTAAAIGKLRGQVVTCLSWIDEHKIGQDNFEFICGCQSGKVFRIVFEAKREKTATLIADLGSRLVDIIQSNGNVYLSTASCLFQLVGTSPPLLVCESPIGSLGNKLTIGDDAVFWLNPVGIVSLKDGVLQDVVTNSTILGNRSNASAVTPVGFLTTLFHHIVLYEGGKLCLVSRISPGPSIATLSHSSALGLAADNTAYYVYSEQRIVQIVLANEASDAWLHYLKKRNFLKSLESTQVKAQRAYVLRSEADFIDCTDLKNLDVCAELYGKALEEDQGSIDLILDEIIMKLSPNKKSLLSFLMRKLDLTGTRRDEDSSVTVVQVNVLFMYCCELFIELMLLHQDKSSIVGTFLSFVEEKHASLDVECIRTLNELLESVGLFDELVQVTELTGDISTAIRIDLHRGNYAGIMERLNAHRRNSKDLIPLVVELSPVLFRFCPESLISYLIKQDWDPELFLTPVMAFSGALTDKHKEEAVKYLYHWLDRKYSSRNERSLLNTLIHLVTDEEELIRLLESVYQKSFFDFEFAMRRIKQHKFLKAELVLLSLCGCFLEATEKALVANYTDLAKSIAWRSRNANTRKKCWLRIIEKLGTNVEVVIELFHESESVTVVDVLPILASVGGDNIDVVRDEVTELVESLTKDRVDRFKELSDYQDALQLIRKDLNQAPNTCLVLSHSQQCHICFELVFSEKFVAFNCSHCFHSECLKDAMAAKLIGVTPNNVDSVIESTCCLCSDSLLLDQLFQPFIDPSLDADLIEAWAIRS